MSLRNFPNANNSITLDFLKGKKLDPRITFERASSATEVGEGTGFVNGQVFEFQENVPRLTDKGLLIEEARTNLLPESGNLNDQTKWYTSTNPGGLNQAANKGWFVASANTTEVVSPDGTNNAIKLAGDTSSTSDGGYKVYAVPNESLTPMVQNTVYSWTLFVKDPDSVFNGDNLLVFMYGSKFSNTNGQVRFDLSNDTFDFKNDINNESASITPYPNGWKKLTATFTNTSSSGGPRYYLQELSPLTNNVTQFTANGKKFYVWGFQIEQGSFPTSYIPTSGSEVTRAADRANMYNIDWFNASESTLAIENNSPFWNGNYAFFSVVQTANVTGNRVSFRGGNYLASSTNGAMWASGSVPAAPSGKSYFNTPIKYAFAYDSTDAVIQSSYGLGTPRSNTTGSAPVGIDQAKISLLETGVVLTAYVTRVSYYPTRLPDSALEALTS